MNVVGYRMRWVGQVRRMGEELLILLNRAWEARMVEEEEVDQSSDGKTGWRDLRRAGLNSHECVTFAETREAWKELTREEAKNVT